jgi:HD superfamily phosphodiesterase
VGGEELIFRAKDGRKDDHTDRLGRKRVMETIYDTIHEKAKPYLDTRQNEIHVSLSYGFARRLLSRYPEADEEIVLPAILLHDVGWKAVPEEKQLNAFGPKAKDNESQRLHEVEGARIAAEILLSLGYDEEKTKQIQAIIEGHDSRREPLSFNDALVKDADKLWRFTPTGVNIDHRRFGIDRGPYVEWLGKVIEGWFFTPEAKVMAREALEEARAVSGGEGR